MKFHCFNPGYEASAALGDTHYTAPSMVQQMRRDLETLPIYWAEPRDQVLVSDSLLAELNPRFTTTINNPSAEIVPWGWAPELKQLLQLNSLPYSAGQMRYWASRERSYELWRYVFNRARDSFEDYPPIKVSSIINCPRSYRILKEEFASSGRGVHRILDGGLERVITQKRGKSPNMELYLEHYYDVVQDRGYEFEVLPDRSIRYLGLNIFNTERGRFISNQLAPAEVIEENANRLPTIPSHQDYIEILLASLKALRLTPYTGYIGVDTGVYRDGKGTLRLAPCFEINIRPTMGHLALKLSEKYLTGNMHGAYKIIQKHERDKEYPFASEQPLWALPDSIKPLTKGIYPLTHIRPNTRFIASLTIL